MTTANQNARRREFESRIEEYHGVAFNEVLEVIDYLREEADCALVGGSFAYGLGNQRSDLDIVLAGPPDVDTSRVPLEHWVRSLRVDVWKLTRQQIDEVFARAEQGLCSEDPFDGEFGDVTEQADLKLLHRIAFGLHIDGPPLEPSTKRDYRQIARDLVRREYAERMRESALVAQLALAAGHEVAALTHARVLVEEALNATMAARGVPFTGDKWLRERLVDTPELEREYAAVAVLPGADEAAGFVETATSIAERLSGLDLSVGALSHDAAWQNTDVQLMPVGDSRVLLSIEQGAVWEIDAAETEIWEQLDSSGRWPCETCDPAQTQLAFGLYASGVLKLRWTRGLPIDQLGDSEEATS